MIIFFSRIREMQVTRVTRYISPISRTYPRSGESRLWAAPGAYRYRSVHDGAAAWPGALAKLGYHLTYANSRIGPPSSRDPFSLRLPLSPSLALALCPFLIRHPAKVHAPFDIRPRTFPLSASSRNRSTIRTSTCTFSLSSRESPLISRSPLS